MAIERMALVSIEGALKKVNRTLMKCCESECFHIIPSNHGSGSFKTLKNRNLFAPLVKRGMALAEGLGIRLDYRDYDDIHYAVSIDFAKYFKQLEDKFHLLHTKREAVRADLARHTQALQQVEHLAGLSSDFEKIFAMRYIRVRFGRLPADSAQKLKYFEDRNFLFIPFEAFEEHIWGVYFTPRGSRQEVDTIFKSLFFDRVRIPDYLTGNADDARGFITRLVRKETELIEELTAELEALRAEVEDKFIKVFCKLKALSDSFDLRTNAAVNGNRFFLSGYIPRRKSKSFKALVEAEEGVRVVVMPHESDPDTPPPIKLRNTRFVRPFEMFTTMYGLPAYGRIDPTPFVALTYFLIFGVMFGDLGQGLMISLLGLVLTKWKKVKLAPIMTRIGLSSAFFGTIYGSVFGNEELITPFFHRREIYTLAGLDEVPHDIFQVAAMVLLIALGIGVCLIIITMLLNIISSLRSRDIENGLFGVNGLTGLVLYASVALGAVRQLGLGKPTFTPVYVVFLILLPLGLLFFREPLARRVALLLQKVHTAKLSKNTALVQAISVCSDNATDIAATKSSRLELAELAECRYIKYQYGFMPYSGYEKLKYFDEERFYFFPFGYEGDGQDSDITGVYVAPAEDFASVERIFASLGFYKLSAAEEISDIRRETERIIESREALHSPKKPPSEFIIEGAVELFETALSYVSNTISFLRIGGFILSHAGLMLTVNIMAESVGAPGSLGWLLVQVFGNLFVIGMEGFLVGIQVLRLEFYEMFSRFHKGAGKPFNPIRVDLDLHD